MRFAGARGITRSRVPLIALLALAGTIGLAGCEGDDGKDGDPGPTGPASTVPGPTGPTPVVDPIATAKPESCVTCHGSAGEDHQAIYKDYLDAKTKSQFKISIQDVNGDGKAITSAAAVSGVAGKFDVTMEVRITKNGLPFNDSSQTGTNPAIQLGSLPQKRFTIQGYFPTATYKFQDAFTTGLGSNVTSGTWAPQTGTITLVNADGGYVLKQTNVQFDPLAQTGWQAYAYIAAGVLETEGMTLYADVADTGLEFGTAADVATEYQTTAVVAGCEACHGAPYLKHGYRAAKVDGLTDFAACKECHFDDRKGSHPDWQWMVDQPLEWAKNTPPADYATKYAYKASVMQDTHQTHAMEFPYPMSMSNCVTCHKGKLDKILVDANFDAETCKSCHPVTGKDAWGAVCTDASTANTPCYAQNNRAPALQELWTRSGTTSFHAIDANCSGCHNSTGGVGSPFNKYHSGYDKQIYNASGQRYSDLHKVSIDSVTLTGNVLDVKFSSATTTIVPELTVSFYGYDSKHMLVSSHTRDGGAKDCNGTTCRFEIQVDGNPVSAANVNRLFAVQADSKPGAWHVTADFSKYVQPRGAATGSTIDTGLASIPELITAGKIKKAEIAVLSELEVGEVAVAIPAVSKTFDLVSKAFVPDTTPYFQGTAALVSEAKCNACHDALGTTFHQGSGYGGKIAVCRTCHVTTSAGSHLEMQSRGIDSYVHAIHKFQYLDTNAVDFSNPVFAKRYALHVEHVFPNFTIKNCEACHVAATSSFVSYNPSDQTKSMPGLESAAWDLAKGWVNLSTGASLPPPAKRNIGKVPQYVVGPSNRACGGCHRAVLINEDDEGGLIAFNSHTAMGGYTIENPTTGYTGVAYVYQMIDKMMNYFK